MKLMRCTYLFIVLCLGLIAGCEEQAQEETVIKPVKVITVAQDEQAKPRIFPGVVKPNMTVDLAFQVPGQVHELPVALGDEIDKGGLIAKLDDRDYKNNLDVAAAELERTKLQYERLEKLLEKGTVAKAQFDEAQAAYNVAQAQHRIALKAMDDTTLYAPFAGRVAEKYVDNFQNVKAEQAIISLQAIKNVDIEVDIPEQDMVYAKRRPKDAPKSNDVVIFSALPDREFPITLKEYSTQADPQTQTYRVVLTMEAPTDVNILPGMSASFILRTPLRPSDASLLIPAQCVLTDEDGAFYVWTVGDDLIANKKVVTVGELFKDKIQIKDGLMPGERIISAGASLVHEGMQVTIYEGH